MKSKCLDIFIGCKLIVTLDDTNELFEASGPRTILDEVIAVWMWSSRMWFMGVAPVNMHP